jgi:hypothetical protein
MAAVLRSQGVLTPFIVPAALQHLLITLRSTGHDNNARPARTFSDEAGRVGIFELAVEARSWSLGGIPALTLFSTFQR